MRLTKIDAEIVSLAKKEAALSGVTISDYIRLAYLTKVFAGVRHLAKIKYAEPKKKRKAAGERVGGC